MLTSTEMFIKQSHSTMLPPVLLQVDGVSLSADIQPYQPPVRLYDYRTKHLQSPVQSPTPPEISPATNVSYSVTMIDGPYTTNKQHKILENVDMPKKLFKDRQIKKAKSLPGLSRGTALSRNSIPRSSTVTSPTPSALSVHTLQDDQLPIVTFDISDDALPLPQTIDHQNEIRRPRVYFADYSKVQFIEDNNETSQQRHVPINDEPRQHRPRLFKKPSITNNVNRTSPSIQRSPARQNLICPSSRQPCHQIGQELNTKKQQSFISPHIYTSRITNLPDIVNQVPSIEPLSNENLSEKYALHREKPITRLLKPANDIPINLLLDFSSRITRNNIDRSSPIQDSSSESHKSDSGDSENRHLPNDNSPLSAISTNRQRPLLRTISLRQQFISPTKLKLTDSSSMTNINYHQPVNKSIPNTQQSTSLKISTSRTLDNNDDLHSNGPLLTTETRSMPGFELGKRLKRSYIIHYNSKKPFRTSTINYSNEANSHSNKPNVNGATQEDFQNLLTIVRPAFASGSGTSSNKLSTISNGSTTNHNRTTESTPLSHNTNLRGPLEFHLTSRTIIV